MNFYDVVPTPLTTTKAIFTITNVGVTTGAIPVNATTGMVVGNLLAITDGTSTIVGTITAIVANTSVTLTTAAVLAGSAGGTMNTSAGIFAATKLNASPLTVNASTGQASVATTYTSTASLGAHTIWASYVPPTSSPINYTASAGNLIETVLKAAAVNVSAVSNTWGQSLNYTISVTSPQGGNPTGTVTAIETVSLAGQTTSGSTTVTVPSTIFLTTGMAVTGAGIPANTTIAVAGPTTITLSNAATATSSSVPLTFTIQRGNTGTLSIVGGVSETTITIPADTLNAGSHSLTFTYVDTSATPVYAQSSTTISQTVAAASTTVALASSAPGTSEVGQSLTFTATLAVTATNPPGTPGLPASGTVTFKNGTATLAIVTLTGSNVSSGPITVTYGTHIVVTYTTVGLLLGSHSITALYSGSGPASPNFGASTSAALTQVVAGQGSLGTLAPLAWTVGQAYPSTAIITYTRGGNAANAASVSTAPPSISTMTTASFVIQAVNGATINISVLSTTGFAVGQYLSISSGANSIGALVTAVGTNTLTIQTVYMVSGSVGSTMASGALIYVVPAAFGSPSNVLLPGLTVAVTTGTTLTVSGTPTTPGVYTTTVFVTDAAGVTVERTYTVTINAQATLGPIVVSTPAPPALPSYRSPYSGSITISGGTGPFTLLAITGGALPTGLAATLSGTHITISGTPTAIGTFNFTMNVKDAAGVVTSMPYSITIHPAVTSVALVSSSTTPLLGTGVTFTATVTSPVGTLTTGSFQFFLDGSSTPFATVALNGTTNHVTTPPLTTMTLGTHTVTATYIPPVNSTFGGSNSNTVTENVVNTMLALSASNTRPNPNQAVTFLATLTAVGASPSPSDVIKFYDNGVFIGSVSLSGSGPYTASLTTSFASGTNDITAVFPADISAGLDAASSPVVVVTVNGLRQGG